MMAIIPIIGILSTYALLLDEYFRKSTGPVRLILRPLRGAKHQPRVICVDFIQRQHHRQIDRYVLRVGGVHSPRYGR